MTNEKTTIILPTHNGSRYISQSIKSCLDQTYKNIELIIVDDASTDNTPDIIASYTDARIQYIRHRKNKGLPSALNTGFKAATGKYLTWTSDDNYYMPEAIEKLLECLVTSPGSDFVYADYWGYYQNTGKKELRILPDILCLNEMNEVGACFLYTRKVYETLGGYNPKYMYIEDYDYWIRITKRFKAVHCQQPLYVYREHEKSLKATKRSLILFSDVMLKYHHGYASLYKLGEATAYFFYCALVKSFIRSNNSLKEVASILRKAFYKIFTPPFTLTAAIAVAPFYFASIKTFNTLYATIKEYMHFFFSYKLQTASITAANNNTRNILYINPSLVLGGTGRFMINMAKNTDPKAFTFHTITTEPALNEMKIRFEPYFKNIVIPVQWARSQNICQYYFNTMIDKLKIGIVIISNSIEGYKYLPLLKRRFPHVKTMDIMHAEGSPGAWPEFSRFTPFIDKRVCISDHLAKYVLKWYEKNNIDNKYNDRVITIHNSVDTELFDPEKYPGGIFKRKHDLPDNCILITYLGRFGIVKNPLLFVNIAKHLLSSTKGHDLRFVMAGDGEESEKIRFSLKKHKMENHFVFTGVLDDDAVRELLADTYSLFITSSNEGIPYAALEAMSMGVPVISTDVGGVREVTMNGRNGFLVKTAEDVSRSFTIHLHEMLNNKVFYESLSSRARQDIVSAFSFRSSGKNYENLFKILI